MKHGELCWYNFDDGRRPALIQEENGRKYIIPLTSKVLPKANKIVIFGKTHSYFKEWKIIYNPVFAGEKLRMNENKFK